MYGALPDKSSGCPEKMLDGSVFSPLLQGSVPLPLGAWVFIPGEPSCCPGMLGESLSFSPALPLFNVHTDHLWKWKVAQSCPTLCDLMGSLSHLQGIFPTQGSNPGLPHSRQIPYQQSHKGSTHRSPGNHLKWQVMTQQVWAQDSACQTGSQAMPMVSACRSHFDKGLGSSSIKLAQSLHADVVI